MPAAIITTAEELIALFETEATAPPPESNHILVRHLQCKESLEVARCLIFDRPAPVNPAADQDEEEEILRETAESVQTGEDDEDLDDRA
jgi:hypothetical protein